MSNEAAAPGPAAKILVVDDTALNVKLLADLLAVKGYRDLHRDLGPAGARAARQRAARPGAARRDDAGHERLRGLRRDPRRSGARDAAGGAGHRARPGRGARQGLDAGADDFLSKPVARPSCWRGCARCCASSRCTTRSCTSSGELAELNRTLEQRVDEGVAAARAGRPAEALLLAAARRADRRRRRRRSAEEPPARDHRRLSRPARLHRVHRDRRSGGGDGRARRVPRGDGPADPRARRHARALHRRRHHGVLQRPGADRRPGAARRRAWRWRCSARSQALSERLAQARLRALRWASASRRASRRSAASAFRADRLRRDRHRHQPGGAAVRRGARRRDPGVAARRGLSRFGFASSRRASSS